MTHGRRPADGPPGGVRLRRLGAGVTNLVINAATGVRQDAQRIAPLVLRPSAVQEGAAYAATVVAALAGSVVERAYSTTTH